MNILYVINENKVQQQKYLLCGSTQGSSFVRLLTKARLETTLLLTLFTASSASSAVQCTVTSLLGLVSRLLKKPSSCESRLALRRTTWVASTSCTMLVLQTRAISQASLWPARHAFTIIPRFGLPRYHKPMQYTAVQYFSTAVICSTGCAKQNPSLILTLLCPLLFCIRCAVLV